MVKLNTYLNFAGNTEEAFNFYRSVFGGEFSSIMRFKDMATSGVELSTQDENKILNISLPVGDGDVLMGSDSPTYHGRKLVKGNNVYITITPQSREEADRIFKALSTGGRVETPMTDQPWNAYYGSLEDKYGVWWAINVYPAKKEMNARTLAAKYARSR